MHLIKYNADFLVLFCLCIAITSVYSDEHDDMTDEVCAFETRHYTPCDQKKSSSVRHVSCGELRHHVFFYKNDRYINRAFCAGNIITTKRVLSTAGCFMTNKKKLKVPLDYIKVAAGVYVTAIVNPRHSDTEQWRRLDRIYSQHLFRHPAYSLAVVVIHGTWKYNMRIAPIPYASVNADFDGICNTVVVKSTSSWSICKVLFVIDVHMLTRADCEESFLKNTRQYYCTSFLEMPALQTMGTLGAGLVCHQTRDPAETNHTQGILVGVTSTISKKLPSLHTRIAMYNKWVTDDTSVVGPSLALTLATQVFLITWYLGTVSSLLRSVYFEVQK